MMGGMSDSAIARLVGSWALLGGELVEVGAALTHHGVACPK
jgi:hypothetical protein